MLSDRLAGIRRMEPILVALGALGIALMGAWQIRGHFGEILGMGDWDFFYELQWVSYRTIHDFHQLPLWNPYQCGGMPLLGNPQSHTLTPWFILTLIFGPFAGLKLELPIFMAIAWSGGYVLARTLKMTPLAALAPAFLFACSSWFFEKAVFGQISMLAFVYMPWIFAAAWKAMERENFRYSAIAGAILGLVFLEGGPYPFTITLTALALVIAATVVTSRSGRPIAVLLAIVLFAVGFSAAKLFPAAVVAAQHPRFPSDTQFNTLDVLRTALFSPNQGPLQGSPNGWGFWELGAYIGPFFIPAIVGVFYTRRAAVWIFAAIMLLWLARGDAGWLWPIVHRLPIFDSLRMPSRFLIPLVLMVGVVAGFGLQWLCALDWHLAGLAAALVILVGSTVNTMLVGIPLMGQLINFLQHPGPPSAAFTQIGFGPDNNKQLIAALENHGVVHCYAYTKWPTTVAAYDEPGYRGEQYLLGRGSVMLQRWSPNALTYRVDLPAPGVLVINQNYDSSWRLRLGAGKVFAHDGRLAVQLAAGTQEIKLWYMGLRATIGFLVSIATLAVAILVWRARPS
jgi:hypothetical protein